nr:Hsp20/alpha crystallin family protein [uncultured Cupriavidus sp.]
MAKTESKLPVTKEQQEMMRPWMPHAWHPLEGLRREVDRLFQSFDRDFKISSFPRMTQDFSSAMPDMGWMLGAGPAVDFAETDKGYEITMELPGLDEKSIEVKLSNGGLVVKGEKRVEKEEKNKDYFLHERHYGSFERAFRMPDGVDVEKIDAAFKNGILTVTFPKIVKAQKLEKKIEIKSM